MAHSHSWFRRLLIASVLACLSGTATAAEADGWLWVYFGTYTRGESKGIYVAKLDLATGKLDGLQLAGEVKNPSFLVLHPSKPLLYACGEVGDFAGGKGGAVSALAIDAQRGTLTLLNQQSSEGAGPCHVSLDAEGRRLLVANYGGGSAACLPIDDDGRLGKAAGVVQHEGSSVDARRQQKPHAHSINLDRAGRFAFVADLGLDKVMIYRLGAKGELAPNDPPFAALEPGSGPRHFAFHPSGKHAYVINELSSTIAAFRYDADRGALTTIQSVSTLPAGFEGKNSTAEVQVHPSGKFVYGSNRGHDSIAAFRVDEETGKLTAIGHYPSGGKTPRNFGIDPTGAYLLAAHQDSDNVVVFRIDESGALRPTGHELKVAIPVCVKFRKP
jgi:6-phosphogluconolactonase